MSPAKPSITMNRKRSIGRVEDDERTKTTPPKRQHIPDRKAVDDAANKKHFELLRTETEYTIRLPFWNEYWVDKEKAWSEDKHFNRFIWEQLEPQAQTSRASLVARIRAVTGEEHVYYLCIPIEVRPKGRALPLSPLDCSPSVLEPIAEGLEKMKFDALEVEKMKFDALEVEKKTEATSSWFAGGYWRFVWPSTKPAEPASQPPSLPDASVGAAIDGQRRPTVSPPTSSKKPSKTAQAHRDVGEIITAATASSQASEPPVSPTTAYHDEQVRQKRKQRDTARRELAAAVQAQKGYLETKLANTVEDDE